MRALVVFLAAGVLGMVLAATPWTADLQGFDLLGQKAFAKPGGGNGGGSSGGNGNGGGNGTGGGNGKGGGAAADADKNGVGRGRETADQAADRTDKARGRSASDKSESGKSASGGSTADKSTNPGLGRSKDAVSGVDGQKELARGHDRTTGPSASEKGLTAASLGRLNAAHSSQRARERAATHSAVGLIGQFSEAELAAIAAAIEGDEEAFDQNISEASRALATAANKEINDDVVSAVNDLLGIDVEESLQGTPAQGRDIEGAIADQASQAQADKTNNGLGDQKDSNDDP